MSSDSSRDSRSSALTRMKLGRPLRVTRILSCSFSTRSASSDRCALASENGTASVIGQNSDLHAPSPSTTPRAKLRVAEPLVCRLAFAVDGTEYEDCRVCFRHECDLRDLAGQRLCSGGILEDGAAEREHIRAGHPGC